MISWENRQMIAILVQLFFWRDAARPRPRFSLVLYHQTLGIGLNNPAYLVPGPETRSADSDGRSSTRCSHVVV